MIQQTDRSETPEVYAITGRGLMPAIFVRFEGPLSILRPVNSRREYSFGANQIVSVADAEKALMAQRVKEVLSSYNIKLIARGTLKATGKGIRVYRVAHPRDEARSYAVTTGGTIHCSCPGFAKAGGCKHVGAVLKLIGDVVDPRLAANTPKPARERETYTKDTW